MPDWRTYLRQGRQYAARVPTIGWLIGGAVAASVAVVAALEMGGPAYAALYEGLSPAQGGKVIGALQKLGIPYQLQAAGDVILVPAPDLAEARLQLGAAEVPGDDVSNGWDKLENAPMTTSDLAQNVMANQALEASLAQSIEQMEGVQSAQVYLATPPDTAFLADQPKPTASVVIAADADAAQSQAKAIASLVAGAVPGLSPDQVDVETVSGIVVNPSESSLTTASQLATLDQVQNAAAMRVAQLLTPILGAGNFRTSVSASIDFTKEHLQQLTYGPAPVISHQISTQSDQSGSQATAMGIPGALSNEPPAATGATPPGNPNAGAAAAAASPDAASNNPHQSSRNTDQTYLVSQTQSDVTKPDWVVNSIAISVVLNKAALGAMPADQIKNALAGAFAYPAVNVSVMAAPFRSDAGVADAASLLQAAGPVSHAVMEIVAALALLFGAVMPLSRWLGRLSVGVPQPALPMPRPAEMVLPKKEFGSLRSLAAEEPVAVAKLLQNWAELDG